MSASARTVLTTSALVAGYERDLPIVRGVDFSVSQGELVAILGPNGAGKSTFVKAIAGLVPVFSGTASLGDVEITHEPVHGGSGTASASCRRPRTSSPRCRLTTICSSPPISCRNPTASHASPSSRTCFPISRRGHRGAPGSFPAASGRCWRWRGR